MGQTRLELYHTLQRPIVREIETEGGSKVKSFEGYCIVFNEPSVVMYDWDNGRVFREYIKPEAVSQEMLDSSDIICTAFHNREKLLARHHADGSGTLQLEKDEVGVKCKFEFGESSAAQDIAVSVERGDMPGMSFSFYDNEYEYEDKRGEDGVIERTITKFDSIFEVTVASSPAYPATTAACREAWDVMLREKDEPSQEELDQIEKEREYRRLFREKAKKDADRARELDVMFLNK